jgi:hypothetical protein
MSQTQSRGWNRRTGTLILLALLVAALLPGTLVAQQPSTGQAGPHLLLCQPAGGQAGTTFDVTVTGQNLYEVRGLYFSRPGIKAELIAAVKIVTEPPKMKKPVPKGPPPTGMRFKVTIPADTPPGIHDVRVHTAGGISNARAFVVGDQKEYVEKEPNNDVPESQRVELNSVVHGVIANPTDVDYFRFAGKKGQRVVLSCLATSIDSRLDPAVELYGPSGTLLALGHDYHKYDALSDAVLPADGDYDVRVCSFGYTLGGPEYFYRLSISTAPWIDAVFPPVVEPGKKATVTVYGRNLPGGKPDPTAVVDGRVLEKVTVTVDVAGDEVALQRLAYSGRVEPLASALDGFELRLRNDAGTSNPFLLTYAKAPVILDAGEHGSAETAQEVNVPCEIAGRVEKKGDRDWYVFSARKGDTYSIEVFGERLGAPVDMQLSIRSAESGKTLAELDDSPEVFLPQLLTRTDDPPRYRFVAPADGKYHLVATNAEAFVQAGPRHLYRLRVTPEQPDFRLVVLPPLANAIDPCIVPQGGHQVLTVLAWRLDGFNGSIHLSADGLPEGVTCPLQVVPPGGKLAFLVMSAGKDVSAWAGAVTVKGKATINGREVTREARAAGATWPVPQPNLPAVARLDRSLVLAVGSSTAAYSLVAQAEPRTVKAGQRVTVPLRLTRTWPELKNKAVQVAALGPPGAFNVGPLTFAPGKETADLSFTIRGDAAPGTYTLVLRGQVQVNKADPKTKKQANLNVQLPSTPITVTVLPSQLAKISLPGNAQVKAGGETALLVKVARLYDYDGPFEVKLVMPPGVKGLEAEEATIPAGASEVRLVLHAEQGLKAGQRQGLLVRAVAMYNGNTAIAHEAKLSVTVVK